MKKPMANTRLLTVFMTSALTFTLASCGKHEPERRQPPPMQVSTLKMVPTDATITMDLPGRVSAIKDAQVYARVTGNIESINFEQGSHVKKGDMLFKIDPRPYQAKVNEAKAAVAQTKALADSANALSKRYKSLVSSGAVSKQEYDDAAASAGKANADIKAAQAALESAQIDLGYTRVESPIDGIVGKAIVTEGALVSNAPPTELALVQQIDQVYVDFNQSASDVARIKQAVASGQLETIDGESPPVQVLTSDGYLYPEQGKLMFRGIAVDSATGQVQLRSLFPNKDHILLPGMYVTVRVPMAQRPGSILAPVQALQLNSSGQYEAFIVQDNKAKKVQVRTGPEVDGKRVILEGLKAGDLLITQGADKVNTGQPVNPKAWVPEGVSDNAVEHGDAADHQRASQPAGAEAGAQNSKSPPKPAVNKTDGQHTDAQ